MRERLSEQFEGNRDDQSGGADIALDFGRMAEIVRNGWWVIASCAFVAGLLAAIIVLQITPKYTGRAQLLLSQPNNASSAIENLFPELTLSKEAVAGEIAVMTASPQLRQVSEALNLSAEAEFNPALLPEEPDPSFIVTTYQSLEDWLKSILGGDPDAEEIVVVEDIDLDRPIAQIARLEKAQLGDQEEFVLKLARNLSVNRVGSSFLVDIAYTSTSRETAAAVPNAVIDAYQDYQLTQKFGAPDRATARS